MTVDGVIDELVTAQDVGLEQTVIVVDGLNCGQGGWDLHLVLAALSHTSEELKDGVVQDDDGDEYHNLPQNECVIEDSIDVIAEECHVKPNNG